MWSFLSQGNAGKSQVYITTVKYPNNGKIKLVTMEIYIVSIALIYKN